MWGTFSDERTGLSFTAVRISGIFIKSPVPGGCLLFTVLYVILARMCVSLQYVQGLC